MTDDTLVNGLKAIFGTSAQGSAPASSALIPYMDASGNPVGLSSMANLASVLGAAPREWPIVQDYYNYSGTYPNIDELTTPCRIRTYDSANTQRLSGNLPFTTAIELFHLCESWEYVQIATTYAQADNANHKIWRRTKSRIEGSAWTVWKTIEFT